MVVTEKKDEAPAKKSEPVETHAAPAKAERIPTPPDWQKEHAYALDALVCDPAGHIQKATTPGTSGALVPAFNYSSGATHDGTVVWADQGYTDDPELLKRFSIVGKTVVSVTTHTKGSIVVVDTLCTDKAHYFLKVRHGVVESGGTSAWDTGILV